MDTVSFAEIAAAREALVGIANRTPVVQSTVLSTQCGSDVYLKAENTQRTGSFKIRGAYYRILGLSKAERAKGVVAASAGNHAQGVAVAAHAAGISATVVMPEAAPLSKIMATKGYGAEVVLFGQNYDEALNHAREIQTDTGATFVHSFDDLRVMAGQGTIGLEILEDVPDVDVVLAPIGGGGLIAGVASALKQHSRQVRIIGVQAVGAAACCESFRRGYRYSTPTVRTIADGIAVAQPGELAFNVIKNVVDDVLTVSDEEISQAMVFLLERKKLLVEGAGAVGVAALMNKKINYPGQKVVAILSGGNVDMNSVAKIIEHGLTMAGRYLVIRTRLSDEPGQILRLLRVFADQRVNVLDIQHYRAGYNLQLNQAQVTITAETRDAGHAQEVVQALVAAGFDSERAN